MKWYLILKDTAVLIIDSSFNRDEMDKKLLEMDNPDRYEVISKKEAYRRIMG